MSRAGPGYVSTAVKEAGAVPTGIDFSERMIAIAKATFPDISFLQGDAQELPFGDASFDGFWFISVCCTSHIPKEHVRKHVVF
jgi:ubiquinone/menaquinone biosynthesis C-methylase UbiE